MSTPGVNPANRSRWLSWKPKAHILADSVESEPTKTTESVSDVFVGAASVESSEIQAELDPVELGPASDRMAGANTEEALDPKGDPDPMQYPDPMDGISSAEWKAMSLNRLFQEQGVTGKPGLITAATIRHGQRKANHER
jgi:hypothetical protein